MRATAAVASALSIDDLPGSHRAGAEGPATIAEPDCTIWVPPGWRAGPGSAGSLVLRRRA